MATSKSEYYVLTPGMTGVSVTLFIRKNKLIDPSSIIVAKTKCQSKSPPKDSWSVSLTENPEILRGGNMSLDLFTEISTFIEENLVDLKKCLFDRLSKYEEVA